MFVRHNFQGQQTEFSRNETAPEKVLRLALNLPHSQPELEREAERIERLLENLSQPFTTEGEELQNQLADSMELLVDGIFGLIEAETEADFDLACQAVLQSHGLVQDLQERLAQADESMPLVA
mgnify:CR=1 FL=1